MLADWRGGALPREPTGLRPAVVVEEPTRFNDEYANVLLVPFTTAQTLVDATYAVRIDPTPENGAPVVSWVLPHHITTTSLHRVTRTAARVTAGQLAEIRSRIALALGLL
ncbi:MAG TPA: type II toxin-antitoxin system PemK/MazF family toxin [Chloroflexota bacterium]|nr:type II toxin-antitoxin system PemK/MazF family toxin [Chloroflexota bacterium]